MLKNLILKKCPNVFEHVFTPCVWDKMSTKLYTLYAHNADMHGTPVKAS